MLILSSVVDVIRRKVNIKVDNSVYQIYFCEEYNEAKSRTDSVSHKVSAVANKKIHESSNTVEATTENEVMLNSIFDGVILGVKSVSRGLSYLEVVRRGLVKNISPSAFRIGSVEQGQVLHMVDGVSVDNELDILDSGDLNQMGSLSASEKIGNENSIDVVELSKVQVEQLIEAESNLLGEKSILAFNDLDGEKLEASTSLPFVQPGTLVSESIDIPVVNDIMEVDSPLGNQNVLMDDVDLVESSSKSTVVKNRNLCCHGKRKIFGHKFMERLSSSESKKLRGRMKRSRKKIAVLYPDANKM